MSSSHPRDPARAGESESVEADAAPEQPAGATPDRALSLDVSFDVLKNARRRHVLRLLATAEEPTTLGELAERIAARENDKPRARLDAQERKRVYVGLYQCHLPRMDDAGVVAFDEDRGTVAAGPHADELYGYLRAATADDRSAPWHRPTALYGIGGVLIGVAIVAGAHDAVRLADVALLFVGVGLVAGFHGRRDG